MIYAKGIKEVRKRCRYMINIDKIRHITSQNSERERVILFLSKHFLSSAPKSNCGPHYY